MFLININSSQWIWISIQLVMILICLVPVSLFIDFGASFVTFIRGTGSSSNFIVEIAFDFISVSIILLRFLIQNIRFFFILTALYELFEILYAPNLIVSNFIGWVNPSNLFSLNYNLDSKFYIIIIKIISGIFEYIAYMLHILFLIFMQLTIYLIISFWLFFFLYSSFCLTTVEKHLFYKRYILKLL
jgi:hypothetical protein